MKYTDYCDFMRSYLKVLCPRKNLVWEIIMTQRRDPNSYSSYNKYQLIIVDVESGERVMESTEIQGYRKNSFTGDSYGILVGSLKKIE